MSDALALPTTQAVPVGYAEKAMASLMQLHTELMEEKERRVDLFRRLMDREQALAELKMYVKVLEEKIRPPEVKPPPLPPQYSSQQQGGHPVQPEPVAGPSTPLGASGVSHQAPRTCGEARSPLPEVPVSQPPSRGRTQASMRPPIPPQVGMRGRIEGWRAW